MDKAIKDILGVAGGVLAFAIIVVVGGAIFGALSGLMIGMAVFVIELIVR